MTGQKIDGNDLPARRGDAAPSLLLSLQRVTRRRLDAILNPSAPACVDPQMDGVVGFDGTVANPPLANPPRPTPATKKKYGTSETGEIVGEVVRRRTPRARAGTGRALSSSLREYGHL